MITTTTLLLSLLAVPQDVVAPDAVPKADPTEAAKKIRNAIKQGSAPAVATISTRLARSRPGKSRRRWRPD